MDEIVNYLKWENFETDVVTFYSVCLRTFFLFEDFSSLCNDVGA